MSAGNPHIYHDVFSNSMWCEIEGPNLSLISRSEAELYGHSGSCDDCRRAARAGFEGRIKDIKNRLRELDDPERMRL